MKTKGWLHIGPDPTILAWAQAALPIAVRALEGTAQPLRCGGTWAVGLDLLPNDLDGAIAGASLPWGTFGLKPRALHPAQLSAILPGYPQPSHEETPAAFAFRKARDAAHLDGLLPIGPDRRRMVKEPHAWILGLPLTPSGAGASPLVVWQGSHDIMRDALMTALAPFAPESWADVDITDAYIAARKRIFDICPRVEVPAQPGEATLLHRLIVHGVAPWTSRAPVTRHGRIIAYFRPLMPSVKDWLSAP